MQIRFADSRPEGDYALVLPVPGKDRPASKPSVGGASRRDGARPPAVRRRSRQRFEQFFDDKRRAPAAGRRHRQRDEGRGGGKARRYARGAAADLGRDQGGHRSVGPRLRRRPGGAGRARGRASRMALRSLSDAAQGQAEADPRRGHDRRRRARAPSSATTALGAGRRGRDLTASWSPSPPTSSTPESFVERVRPTLDGSGSRSRCSTTRRWRSSAWARCSASPRVGARAADARAQVERRRRGGPVAFVGKGVTFDTGGISIKPAQGMEAMKWDMGGAAAVVGAIKALARARPRPMSSASAAWSRTCPTGNAQRPGDVVTTMSGQTVEVINTDAEGRLGAGRRDHLRRSATPSPRRSSTSRR